MKVILFVACVALVYGRMEQLEVKGTLECSLGDVGTATVTLINHAESVSYSFAQKRVIRTKKDEIVGSTTAVTDGDSFILTAVTGRVEKPCLKITHSCNSNGVESEMELEMEKAFGGLGKGMIDLGTITLHDQTPIRRSV